MRVTTKGQVTIPQAIREKLNIQPPPTLNSRSPRTGGFILSKPLILTINRTASPNCAAPRPSG